jgi:hypothetical protein
VCHPTGEARDDFHLPSLGEGVLLQPPLVRHVTEPGYHLAGGTGPSTEAAREMQGPAVEGASDRLEQMRVPARSQRPDRPVPRPGVREQRVESGPARRRSIGEGEKDREGLIARPDPAIVPDDARCRRVALEQLAEQDFVHVVRISCPQPGINRRARGRITRNA